jgi:hypothetical protein
MSETEPQFQPGDRVWYMPSDEEGAYYRAVVAGEGKPTSEGFWTHYLEPVTSLYGRTHHNDPERTYVKAAISTRLIARWPHETADTLSKPYEMAPYRTGPGVETLKRDFKIQTFSTFGQQAADLIDYFVDGIYHLDQKWLSRAAKEKLWEAEHFIVVPFHGELATYDFNRLTRLVLLCHDYGLRGAVRAAKKDQLEVLLHPRARTGSVGRRHPRIREALAQYEGRL